MILRIFRTSLAMHHNHWLMIDIIGYLGYLGHWSQLTSLIEFTLQVLHCLKDCSAISWLAAVVGVFSLFYFYT